MALTREDKLEKLDALECALYEGVKKIKYNDKEVEYRSFDDMRKTIDKLKQDLGLIKKTSRCFAKFSKGLC